MRHVDKKNMCYMARTPLENARRGHVSAYPYDDRHAYMPILMSTRMPIRTPTKQTPIHMPVFMFFVISTFLLLSLYHHYILSYHMHITFSAFHLCAVPLSLPPARRKGLP